MMRLRFLIILLFSNLLSFSQTTATNFNCNDCAGNNHDFFTELNSGKVIIIDWVMPCSSCLMPSKTAYNIVQSYSSSNPDKVFMYVCDDYANTNCESLTGWVDNNGMPKTTKFSNSSIKMSDYGSDGMPKIIVVGGKDHNVYYDELNSDAANITKLQAAINAAIAATTEVKVTSQFVSSVIINPNPADINSTISVNLKNACDVTIEVYNSQGQKVFTVIENEKFSQGANDVNLNTGNFETGIYQIKVITESGFKIIKLAVLH